MSGILEGLVRLLELVWSELLTLTVIAALIALATTPIAFAILGRMGWFQARRGRVVRRPEFSSVVAAMMLVMGIPAIFLALVVKSQYFDQDRYEFDPNKTWSVLDQGRGFRSVAEADEAVRREMERLAEKRRLLMDHVKKLDESMLSLWAAANQAQAQAPAVTQAMPGVLHRLAELRESIGLDGPQQLEDLTAPPADLSAVPVALAAPTTSPTAAVPAPAVAPPAGTGSGLDPAQVELELATVPAPQRAIAAMLPLTDLPEGWTVGAMGDRHLETFSAENLFEKIDGRAESFIQYDVQGMAYTNYHPTGDEANEVQLYVFEMASPLKAMGKYASEKSDDAEPLDLGSEGYTTAGSTMFYAGKYYTQIVSTTDDPAFTDFALELAERIVAQQQPESPGDAVASASPSDDVAATITTSDPSVLFGLLPDGPGRANLQYVVQDAFGYSFLTDVFLADYQDGDALWQGFLRSYASPEEAQAVFEDYLENVQLDEAEVAELEADGEGFDRMVVSASIGLVDVIFVKGNTLGGVNGALEDDRQAAEAFARAFARDLPETVPVIESDGGAEASASEPTPESEY